MREIEKNKRLVEQYPFLRLRNYHDKLDESYEYTWLDSMPDGWRKAFGEQMCEELREELLKFPYEENDTWLNHYRVVQIKEKYGELRWYDNGYPSGSKVYEIINKYSLLSQKICIDCGKPAEYMSTGWISPFCKECAEKAVSEMKQFYGDDYTGSLEENYIKIGDLNEESDKGLWD